MASDWTVSTIGTFSPFKYGRGLPERERGAGEYPVVSSAGVIDRHAAAYVQTAGVVIGRKGTAGSVTFVPGPFWPIDTAFYVEDEPEKRNIRFTYYLLQTLGLSEMNSDSAVPGLNRENAHAVELSVPPLAEQTEIASVLGALDDRIENLRATNETLEAIVQTLFKSWFVDFDPVKAKAEGRTPSGMDEETAALFPSEFEESELGLIPKGWQVCRVDEVASVVKGKSYASSELVDAHNTALVTLKSFKRGGGFRLDGFKPYIGAFKEQQVVVPGDLIVAYTDVTQAAELIGRPAIVVGVRQYQTLVASLDVGIVRPKFEVMSRQFLKGLFSAAEFEHHTKARSSGTTVLHLAKGAVEEFRFACPSEAISLEFGKVAEPLASAVQSNTDELYSLIELRDELLPKLISGELRLPGFGETAST